MGWDPARAIAGHARRIAARLEAAPLDAFRTIQLGSFGAARRRLATAAFDVVLLDLMLPAVPGPQAVTELRRALAAQPRQAPDRLARGADAAMSRAKAAGGTGYP